MKKLERKLKTSRETSQKLIQGKKVKMKRQEKINKEENGITLIALIITIVILIILATITIDFAFGEDGLIKRAMQAKNLTEDATRKEQESLNSLLDEYDDIIGGGGSTPEEPDDEIKGTITFDDYEWQGDGTASVVVRTEETEYTLQYQIVGAEETIEENEWIDVKSGETITGLKYGDTVYARLTDGTNESKEYANVTIEDNIAPQGTTISLSGTSTDTEGSVTATVTLKDNESGVNVTGSKWVINSSSGNIGTEEASYTNSFTAEQEKITIKNTTAGTYYLHVLTKDNAGNKSETISQAVTIEEAAKSEVEEAIKDGHTFDETTQITDEQGNKVTIPEGFKVADDSGKTVQEGIVIEDNFSEDEGVRGSQYVWIPVGKFKKNDGTTSNEIVLGRYKFPYLDKGDWQLIQEAYTTSNPTNYKNSVKMDYSDWYINNTYFMEMPTYRQGNIVHEGTQGQNATAYELEKWVNSVKNNGGYYIGRYEASYASGASSEMDFAVDYSKCKAASKVSTSYQASFYMTYKVGALWNCITQIDALKVSINTYKNSSNGVRSDLINSYAWDTALMYVHEAGNTNYADKEVEGNNITNTGVSGDEVCKINDLAANISEWTTEYCSMYNGTDNFCCTHRGAGVTSGHRSQSYTETAFPSIGFRLTLYLV